MKQNTKNKAQGKGDGVTDRVIRCVSTGVVLLLLGTAVPIFATQQDKDKPQHGQDRQQQQHAQQPQHGQGRQQQQRAQQPQQGQGRQQQQRAQQPQQQRAQQQRRAQQPQQQRTQQQQRAQRPQQQRTQQQAQQQRAQQQRQQHAIRPSQQGQRVSQAGQRGAWQQQRARNWQAEHRTWQQRGGYNGYRIPEARFRDHFGSDHRFRIHSLPVVLVGGYPRFQYDGFWFSLIDPWPEYWSDNWYETDDMYIDYYDGGYYMYNRRHPGVRIAINVFLG